MLSRLARMADRLLLSASVHGRRSRFHPQHRETVVHLLAWFSRSGCLPLRGRPGSSPAMRAPTISAASWHSLRPRGALLRMIFLTCVVQTFQTIPRSPRWFAAAVGNVPPASPACWGRSAWYRGGPAAVAVERSRESPEEALLFPHDPSGRSQSPDVRARCRSWTRSSHHPSMRGSPLAHGSRCPGRTHTPDGLQDYTLRTDHVAPHGCMRGFPSRCSEP